MKFLKLIYAELLLWVEALLSSLPGMLGVIVRRNWYNVRFAKGKNLYIETGCKFVCPSQISFTGTASMGERNYFNADGGNIIIHYQYQNLLKQLGKKTNFISLDPDLRAQQIIENCKAVISMPFTAPALIAQQMGKPTIYYDPCGLIQKNDRGAHGIKIISGKKELEDWFLGVIEEPLCALNKRYVKSNC